MNSSPLLRFRRRPGSLALALLLLPSFLVFGAPGRTAAAICKGTPVATGFDFVVALFDSTVQCGGTVLPGGWILTAAHCGNIQSVVALHKDLNGVPLQARLPVASCVRHKKFNQVTHENDIALIRLVTTPPGLATVAPVDANWSESGRPMTIAGWAHECTGTQELNVAQVPPVSQGPCAGQFLCTSTKQGVRVGKEDSGGPLLDGVQGAPPRLAGVIILGNGAHFLPDVYIRVTSFLTWIKQVQNNDFTETAPCGS